MKIFASIIALLFALTAEVQAQPQPPRGGDGGQNQGSNQKPATEDTIQSRIKTWGLTEEYSDAAISILDTQTIGFHKYDPIYKISISNTHLGHVGAPYQSNIYIDRPDKHAFYFTRNLKAYNPMAYETPYYNTTKSVSTLTYVQNLSTFGGPEQAFDAFLIRNIDPVTNIGFRFHVNKTEPEYKFIESNHRYFNLFASRNTQKHNGYFSLVNGSNVLKENGGVIDEKIDTRLKPVELPVKLILSKGLDNTTKSFSLFTSHEYSIGRSYSEMSEDSVIINHFEPQFSGQYSIEWERHHRNFLESYVDTNFFQNTYTSKAPDHQDSIAFSRFSHMIQLKAFERTRRKFSFGARAFIQNEIVSATHPVPFGYRKYTYSNVNLGASIFQKNNNFWRWSATGQLVVLGRNLGDAQLKGIIDKPLAFRTDSLNIHIEGWYRDQSPDIFQTHLMSNHFQWDNNFKKQHDVVIKGQIDYERLHAKAGAAYTLLSNYLYNNQSGIPGQYTNEFSIFSAWIRKDFLFWRFGWENQVVWQQTSDRTVLRLPVLAAYTSFYYSHYLFKEMKIQLGIEAYYNSAFYVDAYNPATTQFHIQDNVKIGGFPVANAFFNAKLKRTSAFVKVLHANSMINGDRFFMSPSYPLGQMVIRFGFLWSFYD